MTDADLAERMAQFIAENPSASRHVIMKKCNTTHGRMLRIESAGLVKLPAKLSKSMSAKIHRKAIWGANFRI